MKKITALILFAILMIPFSVFPVSAQQTTPLNCGDIVQAETAPGNPSVSYELQITAGTAIDVRIDPLGSTLRVAALFFDRGGTHFLTVNEGDVGISEVVTDLVVAGSNPTMTVGGTTSSSRDSSPGWIFERSSAYGAFTVSFGCTLTDGTVIEPGSTAPEPDPNPSSSQPSAAPAFSGFGFPGLAPVDFSAGVTVPLQLDIANVGSISPNFEGIFGFSFSGEVGEVVNLVFGRQSGNLNLGLVVLSADNQVAFQASLINTNSLNAEFVLPTSGDFTIGLFRVDILPPDAPETTAFSITLE